MSCNVNINENLSSSSIVELISCKISLSICQVLKHYTLKVSGKDKKTRQEKRHKLQLFYDIICAVQDDMINSDSARPTHIQHDYFHTIR